MKYQSFWHFLVINRLISSISTVLEMKIRIKCTFYFHLYCKWRCFWRNLHPWQKFTLPPAVTALTNITSDLKCVVEYDTKWFISVTLQQVFILIPRYNKCNRENDIFEDRSGWSLLLFNDYYLLESVSSIKDKDDACTCSLDISEEWGY